MPNIATEVTLHLDSGLKAKLAEITRLAELRTADEFDGIFARQLATVESEAREARHAEMIARDNAAKIARRNRFLVWERVGGIRFWRVGRIGGSFYIRHRSTAAAVVAFVALVSVTANAASLNSVRDCIAAGNSFSVCAANEYHNETTESGETILRGNNPQSPNVEFRGDVVILRGGN